MLRTVIASTLLVALFPISALIVAEPAPAATGGFKQNVLYAFNGGKSDGSLPASGLIADRAGVLYGTTQTGGVAHAGTIFELLRSGNHYTEYPLHEFVGGADGRTPAGGLVADHNWNLYGMTTGGGHRSSECPDGCGTVFILALTDSGYFHIVLYKFGERANDGYSPFGNVVVDKSGTIYGTTQYGGKYNAGTVFALTPRPHGGLNYRERVLYNFTGGADGGQPLAGLAMDSSGSLYGTTVVGGLNCGSDGCGTVFKLTPSPGQFTERAIYSFASGPDGGFPFASVILDSSGVVYGTASQGGLANAVCPAGCGVVFSLTPTGSSYQEQPLYAFMGAADGSSPMAPLVADANGNLYGTTSGGSLESCPPSGDCGTVFQLLRQGSTYTERVLDVFRSKAAQRGLDPTAGLLIDRGGSLYGTTDIGGRLSGCNSEGCGVVFKLAPSTLRVP